MLHSLRIEECWSLFMSKPVYRRCVVRGKAKCHPPPITPVARTPLLKLLMYSLAYSLKISMTFIEGVTNRHRQSQPGYWLCYITERSDIGHYLWFDLQLLTDSQGWVPASDGEWMNVLSSHRFTGQNKLWVLQTSTPCMKFTAQS